MPENERDEIVRMGGRDVEVTVATIADGAVQTGSIAEGIRSEEPWVVEAIIVRALAEVSLGGPPMGKREAERWLGLYRQNVLNSRQSEVVDAEQPRETDRELHARGAHPEWEYRTTEGPRKQWDDADRPPSDEDGDPDPSWERNVDAGRDGWERWDYTEESYWRRRKP